jgi:hypothetical protein
MCDSIIKMYEAVAPKTAIWIIRAPASAAPIAWLTKVASRKPMVPGTSSATHGVLRDPVVDRKRGR